MEITKLKPVTKSKTLPKWYYYLFFPSMMVYAYIMRQVLGLIWGNIFLVYGLVPLLDQLISHDCANPTLEQIKQLEKDFRYKICLYLVVALEWAVFFGVVIKINTFTIYSLVPMLFMRANLYSSGFLIAHELFHKENIFDKTIGTLHMIKSFYMHFMVEHIYGHHKNVSTPLDPASAPKGMTVYQFIPKSIVGSFLSAYRIKPTLVTLTVIASTAFLLVILKYFGVVPLILHIVSVIMGVGYLEAINYIEHYGLRRQKLPDGSYQRVNIRHSWNAAHRFSNYLFFKLQRHSDHHENSLKPYQTLCTYEDSPQLPHGYLICILLAFFPKTWFGIMDPLVNEYQSKQHNKGTQLAALRIAQQKTNKFTWNVFMVTLTLLMIDIVLRVTT